jgi:signal transduction histidine kinase
MKAIGEAAAHLAWLCPSAASLVALARSPTATVWKEVRGDPGAVLLILRQAPDHADPSQSFIPAVVHEPGVLLEAARLLEAPGPAFVDWIEPASRPILHACHTFAGLASHLAERTGRADSDNAWAAGLLAPLGWLAAAAIDINRTAACLADPELAAHPVPIQQKYWGFDHAGIARRLARRWHLPRWLVAVAGHLDLRVETAQILGADPDLFRLAQLAVSLAQKNGITLHLPIGGYPEELAAGLGLSPSDLAAIEAEVSDQKSEVGEPGCVSARSSQVKTTQVTEDTEKQLVLGGPGVLYGSTTHHSSLITHHSPSHLPLLRDLLAVAADNRQLGDAPVIEGLESDLDQLHRAFQEQTTAEERRLHARKLEALAEFSAGAGHEINNPLAVISGQAQYLLHHESDAGKQKALHTIVSQTQRIHELLNEMMHFARPTPPVLEPVDLPALMSEVTSSLADLAALRHVRLICPQPPAMQLHVDPRHVKTALACLLRNAIEAAPADGWAGVRVEESGVRFQGSGVRSQESGVRGQGSEPGALATGQEPLTTHHSPLTPDHSPLAPRPSPLTKIELIVEDNGPGIAPREREHMFDPFYSGRQAGRGRGLGLPIAWRLARQIGGEVRFEDVPNSPTRFVLSLPRQSAEHAPPTNLVMTRDTPAAA